MRGALALGLFAALTGCGVDGEPVPPHPPAPAEETTDVEDIGAGPGLAVGGTEIDLEP